MVTGDPVQARSLSPLLAFLLGRCITLLYMRRLHGWYDQRYAYPDPGCRLGHPDNLSFQGITIIFFPSIRKCTLLSSSIFSTSETLLFLEILPPNSISG